MYKRQFSIIYFFLSGSTLGWLSSCLANIKVPSWYIPNVFFISDLLSTGPSISGDIFIVLSGNISVILVTYSLPDCDPPLATIIYSSTTNSLVSSSVNASTLMLLSVVTVLVIILSMNLVSPFLNPSWNPWYECEFLMNPFLASYAFNW